MVGVVIFVVILALGFISKPNDYFDVSLIGQNHVYKGVVKQVVKSTDDRQSLILTIGNVDSSALYYFNVLMYLKNEPAQALLPGDQIAFYARLGDMKYTGNPFAFEYAEYMKGKGIRGQFFLENENVLRLGRVFSLNRIFYQTRQKAEAKLRHLPLNTEEFAIVSALVLGDKSMLDYQTKANFSRAGAIHVLSISGLHVGIVFIMLTSLMGQIGKGTVALLKALVVILVLWFYAAISGMSPSVTRATLMFSVFVVAKWKSHQYSIYHSMAIAAFVILVINPYAVIHAGFWLSFMAVGSIVYFYPLVNGWMYFSSPWAKYIWSLIAVSVSAQVGTLALSLYLFDFFPTWFVLSNILVIPLLPMMLVGSILVVVFPADSILVLLLGESLVAMFRYLNQVTAWVGSLPFAQYVGLQLDFYQVLVFYAMLACFIMWQQLKKGKYLVYVLLFLLVGLVGLTVSRFNRYHEKIFVVHQIKGKTAVTLTAFNKCECWINQPLAPQEVDYVLWPLALHQHAPSISYRRVDSLMLSPICNSGKNILMVNGKSDVGRLIDHADVIVFTAKSKLYQIKEWLNKADKQVLVFDASFSYSQCKYLRKEVQNRSLNAHFVTLDGAFVIAI